jgi:hypothetical protein
MSAVQDSNNSSFRAMALRTSLAMLNFDDDMVSMHGVFNRVAWDEDVAVNFGDRLVRNYEAITIVVQDQTSCQFIPSGSLIRAALRVTGAGLARTWGSPVTRANPWPGVLGTIARLATRQAIATAGNFGDKTPLFELIEHSEQTALVRLTQM